MNSGGQLEDSGLYFHSKITDLLHKFEIFGPLSRNLRGGRKPRARRKWRFDANRKI
jgi:hypothetical protein